LSIRHISNRRRPWIQQRFCRALQRSLLYLDVFGFLIVDLDSGEQVDPIVKIVYLIDAILEVDFVVESDGLGCCGYATGYLSSAETSHEI